MKPLELRKGTSDLYDVSGPTAVKVGQIDYDLRNRIRELTRRDQIRC